MKGIADKLVDDYLDRLERELRDLPPSRRRELVQEISEHIAEARAGLAVESEAEIRNLLERIGDPTEIAAEAGAAGSELPPAPATAPVPAPERRSGLDAAALVLLLVGGLVIPVVGWVVGVALLWWSSAWTVPQKVLGTLVVPGGLALPVTLLVFATSSGTTCVQAPVPAARDQMICSGGGGAGEALASVLVVLLGLAALATVVYLGRHMRRGTLAAA